MCELEYTIRQGRLDDVDQVYELLKAERWHVTSEIVKDNFRYYPECCYVADMQNGEIISKSSKMQSNLHFLNKIKCV